MSTTTSPEVRDPAEIAPAGAVLIWALAAIIYGGAIFAWFYAADMIKNRFAWFSPTPFEMSGTSTDEVHKDEAASAELEAQFGQMFENIGNAIDSAQEKITGETNEENLWPIIHIQGTMAGKDGTGSAMLDGQIVAVGSTYNNTTVVSVDKKTVTLKFHDEVKTFFTGAVTREPQ